MEIQQQGNSGSGIESQNIGSIDVDVILKFTKLAETLGVQLGNIDFVRDADGQVVEKWNNCTDRTKQFRDEWEQRKRVLDNLPYWKEVTVSKWNSDKGFGFVRLEGGDTVFLHATAIKDVVEIKRGADYINQKLILNTSGIEVCDKGLKIAPGFIYTEPAFIEKSEQIKNHESKSRKEYNDEVRIIKDFREGERYLKENSQRIWECLDIREMVQHKESEYESLVLPEEFTKTGTSTTFFASSTELLVIDPVYGAITERSFSFKLKNGGAECQREVKWVYGNGWDNIKVNLSPYPDSEDKTLSVHFEGPWGNHLGETTRIKYPVVIGKPYINNRWICQKLTAVTPVGEVVGEIVLYTSNADPYIKTRDEKPWDDSDIGELQDELDNQIIRDLVSTKGLEILFKNEKMEKVEVVTAIDILLSEKILQYEGEYCNLIGLTAQVVSKGLGIQFGRGIEKSRCSELMSGYDDRGSNGRGVYNFTVDVPYLFIKSDRGENRDIKIYNCNFDISKIEKDYPEIYKYYLMVDERGDKWQNFRHKGFKIDSSDESYVEIMKFLIEKAHEEINSYVDMYQNTRFAKDAIFAKIDELFDQLTDKNSN